jgi:hypothetical protein
LTQNLNTTYKKWTDYLEQEVSIAPLITFRIAFGMVMLFSTLRYMYMGWVETQLATGGFHFHYFGFEWVKPLPVQGMYAVYILMALACLGIALGFFYRFFATTFFLCFTYTELIDISYYLNHYYFVSIVSFLLIWVPAHRYFSLDVQRNPHWYQKTVSRWCVDIFKWQIAIVYIYAGLAKINYDWLFSALPLSIWLPAKSSIPIIGSVFKFKITAYLFSWMGMLFDTFIILGLLFRRTRLLAYIAVVFFHAMTGILFQIGVFPIVMIMVVTIFFSAEAHERFLQGVSRVWGNTPKSDVESSKAPSRFGNKFLIPAFSLFFLIQLAFPWRYLLYDGNLFWTEEGYRFSWRVMLMEKAGSATFYVKNKETGKEGSVINHRFLNPHQEKQMAMQPDLILQFAHHLEDHYKTKGMEDPSVRAEVWVTLNGRPAQLLIDPNVDLTQVEDGWTQKDWILPLEEANRK